MDRSAIMRAVKGRDTGPEKEVRRLLWAIAPGYRLNRADIPGQPDLAYIARKQAIFVHGCFWHGHHCARGARAPKANAAYWSAKIARNRARDERVRDRLRGEGWRTLVIWECELRDLAAVRRKLRRFLAPKGRSQATAVCAVSEPSPPQGRRSGRIRPPPARRPAV